MNKAALSARPRQRGATSRRVPRGATAPDPDELLEFLSEPVEDPEDEALIRFPGRFAIDRYAREAFVAIASARACADRFPGDASSFERLGVVTGKLLWRVLARRGRFNRRKPSKRRSA
jgi:hypothetical protein